MVIGTGAPVRLGVLGCADIARRRMLPAAATVDAIEVVAVASRSAARAGQLAERWGADGVAGYEALLERPDVDAVYVPLPNALHAEWVERSLLAGRHVLAEKPLTTSPRDTIRLVALATQLGLHLAENVMFTRHTQHAAVRELIAAGTIGEPHTFTAEFTVPPRPATDVRHRPDLGGGALFDGAVYPLEAVRSILGGELDILAAVRHHDERYGVDVGGSVLAVAAPNVAVHLRFGLDGAYRTCYEVAGNAGTIRVDRAYTPPADHVPEVLRTAADGRTSTLPLAPCDQYAASLREFADAVRQARPTDPEPILWRARMLAAVAASGATLPQANRQRRTPGWRT